MIIFLIETFVYIVHNIILWKQYAVYECISKIGLTDVSIGLKARETIK